MTDRSLEQPFDEACGAGGRPRRHYATLFERIDAAALSAEAERVRAELAAGRVSFGNPPRPFLVDPVPRIIGGEEWTRIEAGLAQRARALNAFLADAYGERRIVTAGTLPAALIETAAWFEPAMADPEMPAVRAHVAGPDLVRAADGELVVLEDNLRAPSGLAYALAARSVLRPLIERSGLDPRSLDGSVEALGELLRAAAPDGVRDPTIVLLNDGETASAMYEHRELGRRLGLAVVGVGDLRRRGERLLLEGEAVDVVYRRVDDERLTLAGGAPSALGRLLIEPLRAGALACVNSPGSGLGDDKAVHAYVERMIGFYLGEQPLLRSVPSRHLGEPSALEWALANIGDLVIKPRGEFGGAEVMIGPAASEFELERAAEMVRRDPGGFVAQEPVSLSVHPTVVGDRLEGRRVDLRPFVLSDERANGDGTVIPGGLTRFARGAGDLVVNSGQGGGAKDTWMV